MQQTALKPSPRVSIRRWLSTALVAALVLLAGLLPLGLNRENIWNLFFLVCLYITLGQSWNILAGFAGQTSLGHAAFFGIGALVTRNLWLNGMPFALALLPGGLAAVLFAMIIAVPAFRLRGAYFAIATLGMAEVLRIVVGENLSLISTMSAAQIATYDLPTRYYVMFGVMLATLGASYLLLRSSRGLGILAVREDEEAARASGVNVLGHKLLALALSSFFAGLAGAVFAFQQISYYPAEPFNPSWSFEALLVAYIGGLGSQAGPVIGAIFFIVIHELLALKLVDIHQAIFGVLFILIVLLFPGGLMEAWNRFSNLRRPGRRKNAPLDQPAERPGRSSS